MIKRAFLLSLFLVVGISFASEENGAKGNRSSEPISDPILDTIFAGYERSVYTVSDSKIILWDEAKSHSTEGGAVNRIEIEIKP